MLVSVLGAAAGGGFPQWNCNCNQCRRLRQGTLRAKPRSQIQVAVSADGRQWHLLGASPDLTRQIEANPCLHPRQGLRDSPIVSVVLTCAEVDQSLGLLLLREMHPFTVYATASVRDILCEDNSMFRMLHRAADQVEWRTIAPGVAFEIEPGMHVEPIPMGGGYPSYVGADRLARCRPEEAVMGLSVDCGGRMLLFLSGVPAIGDTLLARMEQSDLLLLDGTFWSDDEFRCVWPEARTARAMGHLPISGPGGSLECLTGLQHPRKVFIHINNTNPILDEQSDAHRTVRESGWEVACDGMTIDL
ncbi:MAG TPA: pyrroloquinoline quinone biosynthesis protein PqqB [Bryobacteraceae bacterium]|nr:pyrroloquinoline quinone biosynthesis protein PqqB [Bryobacteraceae bacterium]